LPPRRVPLLERFRVNPPRVAIRWSRFAPPRPRLNVPRPKMNIRAPELATTRFRVTPIRDDLVAPLAVIAGLVLASIVAVGAIVAVQALDTGDDNSGIVGTVTETPKPTDTLTPSGSETPSPTEAPSTETPAPETATPVPTTTPAPTSASPATTPQGVVSVAYWANKLNTWWFGDLKDSVANYEEGQDIPFIVRWGGVAGQTYWLHIVSDCQTPDTFGTIDYLSGVQDWGAELTAATYGPGSARPDGAIPVPDTPNFDPDNGNVAILTLYGAKFPVLPLPPHPDDNCDFQRTQDLPVQAYGGPIIFLASAHLGTATVYSSGEGASTASVPFGLHISVDGVGSADVMVDPSAIADVER
jgi:hypothetical protein